MMPYAYGYQGGMMFMGWILYILIVVLLVLAIVALWKKISGK